MEYAVTTCELTRAFGSFIAVDKLSVNIKRGEVYGFLGPNGSGKTTAIRMLCGILQPTSGSGAVLGFDLVKEPEKIKQKIGYMSQKFSLYDDLTVFENLDFYAGIYGIPYRKRKNKILETIDTTLLTGRELDMAVNLGGGLKQRLALGCAIISQPSILFLDEPTSGISPAGRRMFFKLIKKLSDRGTTIVVTTHFMDEAERCHRIAFLSEGRLIACDTPDNLKKSVIKGCMVELELPDVMDRVNDIEGLPYVKECSVHGPVLHVLLEAAGYIETLNKHTKINAKTIRPSLEDVFITLARQEKRQVS